MLIINSVVKKNNKKMINIYMRKLKYIPPGLTV